MADTTSSSSGATFFSLLTVLFIGLKLTHVIAWSWWWVLAPLWLPATFVITIFAVVIVLTAILAS